MSSREERKEAARARREAEEIAADQAVSRRRRVRFVVGGVVAVALVAGVVAELGGAQGAGHPRGGGQQDGQGEREQPDRLPRDAVDAAGQPAQHQLDVVLVDAGEDVLDDRMHGGGEADAGQHEPEAAVVAGDG